MEPGISGLTRSTSPSVEKMKLRYVSPGLAIAVALCFFPLDLANLYLNRSVLPLSGSAGVVCTNPSGHTAYNRQAIL